MKQQIGMFFTKVKKQWQLQVIAGAGMLVLFLFSYMPLFGVIMAFKNYSINMGLSGIFTSQWVGFKWFKELFTYYRFKDIIWNTLALSLLKLVFTFPAPILLAVLLNEVRNKKFKSIVQTVSYLPNFISWVLLYTIANAFLNTNTGILNQALVSLGLVKDPVPFLTSPGYFRGVAVFMAVWKNSGYWAIIFLASITSIDPQLYEAADIDGAGRLSKIWYITLPGIKSAAVTVLILSLGSLMGGGMGGSNFEQAYIFGNTFNNSTSEILQTYAFNTGLSNGRFAYATAVDLLQSIISIILILLSNWGAKKITEEGIF